MNAKNKAPPASTALHTLLKAFPNRKRADIVLALESARGERDVVQTAFAILLSDGVQSPKHNESALQRTGSLPADDKSWEEKVLEKVLEKEKQGGIRVRSSSIEDILRATSRPQELQQNETALQRMPSLPADDKSWEEKRQDALREKNANAAVDDKSIEERHLEKKRSQSKLLIKSSSFENILRATSEVHQRKETDLQRMHESAAVDEKSIEERHLEKKRSQSKLLIRSSSFEDIVNATTEIHQRKLNALQLMPSLPADDQSWEEKQQNALRERSASVAVDDKSLEERHLERKVSEGRMLPRLPSLPADDKSWEEKQQEAILLRKASRVAADDRTLEEKRMSGALR